MRVLLIHQEAEYFAGAEKVLGYFLKGLVQTECEVTVAAVRQSRIPEILPAEIKACWLPENSRFSPRKFIDQCRVLARLAREQPFHVLHGWAARDWELTGCLGRLARRPTLGTLHDHPRAPFISPARQRLMRLAAALGLHRIACVSDAVKAACEQAHYNSKKLVVVHNGLPPRSENPRTKASESFQLGYLGQFSERKGLRGLFLLLDEFSRLTGRPWEMRLAGDAQEADGRRLVEELKANYAGKPWWPNIHWLGWVERPFDFLASLDLLICPSSEFDPFPTVLLEAGQAGVAVLGSRVGGVPEIVEDGVTGWLFEPAAWAEAARKLQSLSHSPTEVAEAGRRAKKRVEREFAMKRMVADYLKVYMDLSRTQ